MPQSLTTLQEVLDINLKLLNGNRKSLVIADILTHLASVNILINELNDAEAQYLEVLDIQRNILGKVL